MPQKTHPVAIGWDGNKWKASPGTLGDDPGRPGYPDPSKKIKKNELIRFSIVSPPEVEGSDVTLFFPDESIFGLSHVKLLAGEDITLEVRRGKAKATPGDEKNLYAAFCHKPNCFADGDSNPIIIIE